MNYGNKLKVQRNCMCSDDLCLLSEKAMSDIKDRLIKCCELIRQQNK